MTKYMKFDKCLIELDDDLIILNIKKNNKNYMRIGSGKTTFIVGKKIPQSALENNYTIYQSLEIYQKINNLYDYSQETSGVYTSYFSDGKLHIEYFHNNQIKEGTYKEYSRNGYLIKEYNYISGKMNGNCKEFDIFTGELIKDMNYKENNLHGVCKIFKSILSSVIYEEYNYIDNIKHGYFIIEYKNNIIKKGMYNNGKIIESEMKNKNTNIILEKICKHPDYEINELLYVKTYYESGNLKEEFYIKYNNDYIYNTNYIHKNGIYIEYYESGKIMKKSNYYNNKNIDETITYYESGRVNKNIKYGENNKELEKTIYYDTDLSLIEIKQTEKETLKYNENNILNEYMYRDDNLCILYSVKTYKKTSIESEKELIKKFAQKLLESIDN